MGNVQILMSTYNGEKYVEEQIESILNQTYPHIKLLIRDDGSKDSTIEILSKYEKKNPNKIKVILGTNIGVTKSFYELLNISDKNCSFYAFADQDDVWNKEKIKVAISYLKDNNKPQLYFSNLEIVNKDLKKIRNLNINPNFSKKNSIVQNKITGCSMVFNKVFLELLLYTEKNYLDKVIFHDFWAYMVASYFGIIKYDSTAQIKYRRHELNVSENNNKFNRLLSFFYRLRKKNNLKAYMEMNKVFLKVYGTRMSFEDKKIVKSFVDSDKIFVRIENILKNNFYKEPIEADIVFKIFYLFGKM